MSGRNFQLPPAACLPTEEDDGAGERLAADPDDGLSRDGFFKFGFFKGGFVGFCTDFFEALTVSLCDAQDSQQNEQEAKVSCVAPHDADFLNKAPKALLAIFVALAKGVITVVSTVTDCQSAHLARLLCRPCCLFVKFPCVSLHSERLSVRTSFTVSVPLCLKASIRLPAQQMTVIIDVLHRIFVVSAKGLIIASCAANQTIETGILTVEIQTKDSDRACLGCKQKNQRECMSCKRKNQRISTN